MTTPGWATRQQNGQTNGPCPQWTFNTATNQITNSGFSYDASGDLTGDGTHTYQWNAEGRLKTVDNGNTASYTYNALGWRVEKKVGSAYTEVLYDQSGESLGENNRSSWTQSYVNFGGRHLAIYANNSTYFPHVNSVGSTVMVSDYTGAIVEDKLFYPWGQDWETAGTLYEARFAKLQHRDSETSLDPTPNRMFSSTFGRWLSPDPRHGDITNPQSLNRYAYALNNATTLIDPTGLDPCDERDPTNKKVLDFIRANLGAAQKLAEGIGCPVALVLGLSAEESNYGASAIALNAHNYFGLHAGAPGAIGTYTTTGGRKVSSFPAANGFQASGQAFVDLYGWAVKDVTDPKQFAQDLVNAGFNTANAKTGGNPNFVPLVRGAIAAIQSRINCPQLRAGTNGGGGGATGGPGGGTGGDPLTGLPSGWDPFEPVPGSDEGEGEGGGVFAGASSSTILGWSWLC